MLQKFISIKIILLSLFTALFIIACTKKEVYFINLKNGDTVKSPFQVEMGIKGMEVVPAGPIKSDKGHHHLLINQSSYPKGETIPTDAFHLHFGGGQTSIQVELPSGRHRLTLQFADGAHRSYGPDLSATIEIIVE